jgi:hypothetical protein
MDSSRANQEKTQEERLEKMFSEKIALVKPVFMSIQNLKKKENLKFLLLLSVFLCLMISPGAAASNNWKITPENPVIGDTIEIKGTGFTGESAEVLVAFEKEVQVEDGSYEYLLEDVIIPSGLGNSFTVQATGADDLNVRAKMLLWITKTAEAKNGIATVSRKNVPPGTYKIVIDGKSSASSVKIKITAIQQVEVDSGGNLNYKYDTKSIPAGNFEVDVGGAAKQVELQSSEGLTPEINSSTEQNLSEGKDNESLADIAQKESSKSSGKSHGSGLKPSSKNNIVDNSSTKNKGSLFAGIKSILETPKAFMSEDLKPYIQENSLVQAIRNPPKVPSFLLGFTGALLIGLAILTKKR